MEPYTKRLEKILRSRFNSGNTLHAINMRSVTDAERGRVKQTKKKFETSYGPETIMLNLSTTLHVCDYRQHRVTLPFATTWLPTLTVC